VDYSVETFRDSDLSAAASLHAYLQPRERGANERYLRWKYFENPFIRKPLITVVRYGSEIVAMEGLMGMAWSGGSGEDSEVLPQFDDLIVHPDHRRRGLTTLLFQRSRETSLDQGYRAMISMSGGDVSQSIALTRGWVEVRELKVIYLVRGDRAESIDRRVPRLRPVASQAKSLARRFGYPKLAPPPDRFVDAAMEPILGPNPHVTVSAEADVEAMSALAVTVGRHASVRSADFLRWRLGNPDRNYRFVYWRDTHLRGYLIVGWKPEDRHRAMIIDHCCEDASVFTELLHAVTRIRRCDIELMASTLPHQEADVAHRLGFRRDPECTFGKRRFLLWPLVKNEPQSTDSPILSVAPSWRVDLIDTLQG